MGAMTAAELGARYRCRSSSTPSWGCG